MLNRERQIPVFAPYYISVFNAEAFEITGLEISVMLWMGMALEIGSKVNGATGPVTENNLKRQLSQIFCIYDGKKIIHHNFSLISVHLIRFFSTKKSIHFFIILL